MDIYKKYFENHRKWSDLINTYLLFSKTFKNREQKNLAAIKFYIHEEEKHESNEAEIFCCLHNNLHPAVCGMVIDSNFPGFLEKHFNSCLTFLDKLNRNERFRKIMYHSGKLGGLLGHYSDFVKDTFLFITIFSINGGIRPLMDFPFNFTSIIVICLGSSIFVPLLISTIYLTKTKYQIIYRGCKFFTVKKTKTIFIKICVILLSVINPVILLNFYETMKQKARLDAKRLNHKVSK